MKKRQFNSVGILPSDASALTNRAFCKCPKCGKKATVEQSRVSRDMGATWKIQTLYRCHSMAAKRCDPTIYEQPEGVSKP